MNRDDLKEFTPGNEVAAAALEARIAALEAQLAESERKLKEVQRDNGWYEQAHSMLDAAMQAKGEK